MRVARGKELVREERSVIVDVNSGLAKGFYYGKDPPRNLIGLPTIDRGYTVHEVWSVWNFTLRELDYWHKGLI
jgi:hypothetical protein